MTNIQQHVSQMKKYRDALVVKYGTGPVPIISIEHYELIEHKANVVVEASAYIAAKMLTDRTHREATPDEYERYKTELAERTEEYRRLDLETKAAKGQIAFIQQVAPTEAQKSKRQ